MAQRVDITQLDPTNPQHAEILKKFQEHYTQLETKVTEQQQLLSLQDQSREIGQTLARVGQNINNQTLTNAVPNFSGKPKELNSWLSQIEKHVYITLGAIDDLEARRTAYRCSRGTVSDYIRTNLDTVPQQTWVAFKAELKKRFGEQLDTQTLLLRLRAITQRPQQSVQVFAEVINSKASEIYKDELDTVFAQRELVSIYAKGLRSKAVAKRLLERNPATLAEAATYASTLSEQQNRLIAHGLTEEPMEVDAIERHQKEERKSKAKGKPGFQYAWKDNKPVCFKCNKVGHMGRNCRVKQPNKPANVAEITQSVETNEPN